MKNPLDIDILPQPDETTCGPTCLHAVYRYYDDNPSLDDLIREIRRLDHGGTLAVFLACHALKRGYKATIYTYNLQMFDPAWFGENEADIQERLYSQMMFRNSPAVTLATEGYLEFLQRGGILRFEDLTKKLIRRYLKRDVPILTGLSATYLYHTAREYGPLSDYDDIRGAPSGHFVILGGYQPETRSVSIIDPFHMNPMGPGQHYDINLDRVIGAILLGVLTHDANLLIIEPVRKNP